MNKLHIELSTYCEIEIQLGILTDDGLNRLLARLQDIVDTRQNAGMIGHVGLFNIIKLIRILKIERDDSWGNTLTIDDYDEINKMVFDNQSNKEKIKIWLLKDMLVDVAEMIDEGFSYGLDSSDETKLLNDFLFYLTIIRLRFH